MSAQPMDDEGDIDIAEERLDCSAHSAVSTPYSRAVTISDLLSNEEVICAAVHEPDTLAVTAGDRRHGFSYTSQPERDIFASKKGQPLQTTRTAKFNGSIRTRDRASLSLSDAELMNVYRFDTKKSDVNPQDTAKLYPAEFSKVPLKFSATDRGINDKLKVVTGPALGYMYAYSEAQNSEADGKAMLKQIRKYKNGIAPLDKLAMIEDDLGHVVQRQGQKLSHACNKSVGNTRLASGDTLPHLTRNEYQSVRKQIYNNSEDGASHQGQMREKHNIATLSLGEGGHDDNASQNTFKTSASFTITVPHSVMSAKDMNEDYEQLELSNRYNKDVEEEEEEVEEEFTLGDFATPRSDEDNEDSVEERRKRWLEKQRLRQLQMQTVRQRRVLRSVRKDPSRLANQLPRSQTGEYLVKDYAQGKYNHLFEFGKDVDGGSELQEAGGGVQACFQYTKNKLLSKKDKVFLKLSEELVKNDALDVLVNTNPDKDEDNILYSPSTNISVDCHSSYGPADCVQTMSSRYNTSAQTLTERELTGKPHEIAGFIKTMVMKKQEIKNRLICYVCKSDACYFCGECAQNYCKLCWNSISHHETMEPDEVWNNRRPENVIAYKPNDERGMQVFLRPDAICQGKISSRGHTPVLEEGVGTRPKSQGGGVARPKSPPLQSFAFPPPGGVPVVDYRGKYDWNTLSKKRKVRMKREQRRAGGGGGGEGGDGGRGLQVSVPSPQPDSRVMHDLIVSPPKHRAIPDTQSQKRPPSPLNKKLSSRTLSRAPSSSQHYHQQDEGNQSPDDSLMNPPSRSSSGSLQASPANSQSSKNNMSPPPQHQPKHFSPVKTVKPQPVVMEPGPTTTLIWQVAPTGRTLCPVSSLTPGKMMRPAKGITSEFFPKEWKKGRAEIHQEFKVYNGVTVATRTMPPHDNQTLLPKDPKKYSELKKEKSATSQKSMLGSKSASTSVLSDTKRLSMNKSNNKRSLGKRTETK